jgi:hypothetical protein
VKLNELQAAVITQLSARAELAAFGSIFAYNPAQDEEESAKLLIARIQEVGVAIEVFEPDINSASVDQSGATTPIADYIVAVSESPVVAHTPAAMNLMQAVIDAGCTYLPGRIRPSLVAKSEPIRENGYVLRLLNFSVRVDGRASA